MIRIGDSLIGKVIAAAGNSDRKRMHHNFHESYDEPVQRLLNAIEPGSYIRPHMHRDPDKTETFLVLKGRILVVEFNDDGTICEQMLLDPRKGNYGAEIRPGTYHMVIGMESGSVAYEIKNGPFDMTIDKKFAPWAPEEGTPEGQEYLEMVTRAALQNVGADQE